MHRKLILHRVAVATVLCGALLGGCDDGADNGQALEVDDERVIAADGRVLLEREALPRQIAVDEHNRFAAANRLSDAQLAPDGAWLAASSAGTAHGAGWLIDHADDSIHPAAFQYGGTVRIGPWSDDSRFVVFIRETPAGGELPVIADRNSPARTAEAGGHSISALDETATLDRLQWDGHRLRIEAGSTCLLVDAAEHQTSACPD